MTTVQHSWQQQHGDAREDESVERLLKVIAGGFSAEALTSGAAIVLAILGLANIYPLIMAPVAAIAFGAALILRGTTLAASFHPLVDIADGKPSAKAELGSGLSAELIGGVAGIALGVLALVLGSSTVALTLLAAAAITFGGELMLSSMESYRLSHLSLPWVEDRRAEYLAERAERSGAVVELLSGIAAIVLGILALTGTFPWVLTLVALLTVSASQLIAGLAGSGHSLSLLKG